jgi:CHASE3 domain sensor protein
MLSRLTARIAFVIAICLLLVCAVLMYGAMRNLAESEQLVVHSHKVQELLGDTESAIASAARARLTYVFNGGDDGLEEYERDVEHMRGVLRELRRVTADNPVQQKNCDQLEALVADRIQLWEKSIALKQSGRPTPAGQPDMTRQSVAFADEIVGVSSAPMRSTFTSFSLSPLL